MKNLLSAGLILLSLSCYLPGLTVRDLTPIRGYYEKLAKLDGSANSERAAWDKLSFPRDEKRWEEFQKPSGKTFYLAENPELVKVPPPPANSSRQTLGELDYLYALQLKRTKEDIRTSFYLADVWYSTKTPETDSRYKQFQKNLFHIGQSIGTWFTPEKLPKTRQLLANVWRDADYFIWYYKYKYARIRPYKLDSRLKNLEETDWEAYPSGHAGNSYVAAYVYQEIAPEFTDIFVKDALDMAHSREILGVHYPSDSEASRVLARNLVNQLLQNAKFQADLAEVKAEWKTVRDREY